VIKLTVHESVEAALQKAFPKPAASAQRALAKYISVVESMVFDALQRGQTPEQRKLGLYSISLDKLANKGGQIGPKKIRVHKWLTDNDMDIVQTVVKGTKFSSQNSLVKLTALVKVQNTLQVLSGSLSAATTDEEIDTYLSGDDVSNIALFDHLYPEYGLEWRQEKLNEMFDWVPVDIKSVKAYVYWLETQAIHIKGQRKDLALRQALTLIGIASVTQGYYLQRKKPSPFGRMYYEGTSVQNVNKELRRAMLGNCWEYDIRSSVVAWKMGYARSYLASSALDQNLKTSFPATLLYLEDKADFMASVRHYVFTDASPVPMDLRPKLLKQAFTAISFGARQTAKGWLDASGNWNNPALVEILQNAEDRDRFLSDPTVKLFIKEQNALDDYLFGLFKLHRPDLLKEAYLQTESGRPSKAKVLAFLYQHGETQVMDIVRQAAIARGHLPIANVHDAIFFKRRLGAELKSEIEWQMREQTGNPYWHLTPMQLERYQPISVDALHEEEEHKERITQEESFAREYMAKLASYGINRN